MPFIVATIIMEGHGRSLHNNTETCLHASGEEYMQYAACFMVIKKIKIKRPPSPDLCNQNYEFYFYVSLPKQTLLTRTGSLLLSD